MCLVLPYVPAVESVNAQPQLIPVFECLEEQQFPVMVETPDVCVQVITPSVEVVVFVEIKPIGWLEDHHPLFAFNEDVHGLFVHDGGADFVVWLILIIFDDAFSEYPIDPVVFWHVHFIKFNLVSATSDHLQYVFET